MQYSSFAFIEDCEGCVLEEIAVKQKRVLNFLDAKGMQGILLRRRENVSWITAGRSDRTVLIPSESAIAAVLLLQDGRRFYLAPNNESARLADEDFNGLGFEAVVYGWQESNVQALLAEITGDTAIASDMGAEALAVVNIAPLRWQLLPQELERYRELGRATADATARVLMDLEPGVSEHEMAARVSYELVSAGVEPSVLLMAVDDRIGRYKHALPHDGVLQKFGMLNLCARRWGLSVSLTRYVHFGTMPEDLISRFEATARVHASLLRATRAGKSAGECFQLAGEIYETGGFKGEEYEHHQGGATGYLEREWLARPGGSESLTAPQAFAWNPSISGVKTEETVLLHQNGMEPLTLSKSLPGVETTIAGETYWTTGVLVR
jgi:Xaa-Pro dipeptidase